VVLAMSFDGIANLAPVNRFPPPPRPALTPACAYCGRSVRDDGHGNCIGCGAPITMHRPVIPQPRPLTR
jgi:hypothetical protein